MKVLHMARASNTRRRHVAGQMNRTEHQYAQHLDIRKAAGEILEWHFEPLKLRLADRTYYSPDFMVILPEGWIELHEIKGFWEDDARVKIKVAAETFPYFRFISIKRVKEEWKYETIGAAHE